MRKIHNDLRGSEYSHFSICFNEEDPLAKPCLKGMVGSSITSELYAFSLDNKVNIEEYKLNAKRINFEYSYLI